MNYGIIYGVLILVYEPNSLTVGIANLSSKSFGMSILIWLKSG